MKKNNFNLDINTEAGISKKRQKSTSSKKSRAKTFWPPWPERKEAVKLYEAIRKMSLSEAVDYIEKNPPSPGAVWFLIFEAMERKQSDLGKKGKQVQLENDPKQKIKNEIKKKWVDEGVKRSRRGWLKGFKADMHAQFSSVPESTIGTWHREFVKEFG